MVGKNNQMVVKDSLQVELSAEANKQLRILANCCMQSLKQSAAEYAQFAVHRVFDHLIDSMNKKIAA